jgi:hypothetical protein
MALLGKEIDMNSKEILQNLNNELAETKAALTASQNRTFELKVYIRQIRAAIKMERGVDRVVREDHKKLRAQKKEERRVAQVAKLEARLAALKAKEAKKNGPKAVRRAARKASPVTLIPAETAVAA